MCQFHLLQPHAVVSLSSRSSSCVFQSQPVLHVIVPSHGKTLPLVVGPSGWSESSDRRAAYHRALLLVFHAPSPTLALARSWFWGDKLKVGGAYFGDWFSSDFEIGSGDPTSRHIPCYNIVNQGSMPWPAIRPLDMRAQTGSLPCYDTMNRRVHSHVLTVHLQATKGAFGELDCNQDY
ncbi:unnamed protein product [Citrullus colocynthis]|uniref:Uncharacterized protein n=1 Tax=Citrullus colocynthis TaxID=252529 RepID=A0ABP0Y755_9ROSI